MSRWISFNDDEPIVDPVVDITPEQPVVAAPEPATVYDPVLQKRQADHARGIAGALKLAELRAQRRVGPPSPPGPVRRHP